MHHLQGFGFTMQLKNSWRKNQDLKMLGSWLSGMFPHCFLEHTSQASVYSLLPVLTKQELMQRDWIRVFQQKVAPFKKKKNVVHGDDLTGLFQSWQVGLGTHNSLPGGSVTLLHLLSECRMPVQLSEHSCKTLTSRMGQLLFFAHGLVDKYFLMEKNTPF